MKTKHCRLCGRERSVMDLLNGSPESPIALCADENECHLYLAREVKRLRRQVASLDTGRRRMTTRVEDEDAWVPVPELITNEQVRAMNELLATPYTNGPVLDYFDDEDEGDG